MLIAQYCMICFRKKLLKVVMSLNRQIMADSYYKYSSASVNQFETKDKCFKFPITVSRKGNNMKMKLNLKMILLRLQS